MAEPGFTPGPWGINKYGSIGSGKFFREPIVAMTEPLFDDPNQWAANNSLIAAAPALYEACGDALELLNTEVMTPAALSAVGKTLEAALSLALGEKQHG